MSLVKIKGQRDPIEIPYAQAVPLKNRWLGINGERKRDSEESFDLGNGFGGRYGLIDWIRAFPDQKKVEKVEYSNSELDQFEKVHLSPYLNENRGLSMEREMDFLKDKGCISLRKLRPIGECKTASDFEIAVKEDMMSSYAMLTDKISAWKDGRARASFGESQRLAQLDELAGQMEVHAQP